MEVDEYMEDGEVEEEGDDRKPHPDWKSQDGADQTTKSETRPATTFTFNDPELFKKRAARFGINEENAAKPVTKEQMVALYEELQVPSEEVKLLLDGESSKLIRFDAVHIHGTDEMSTEDLFDYFSSTNPASIEWINDSSCNMVWLETWQAAKALLETSTETVKSELKPMSDTDAMDHEASGEIPDKPSLPPGVWRKGIPHPKAENLLLRFTTVNDCKVKGAQKFSSYYVKHGNPNYGGMKGLISTSRKRRIDDMRRAKKSPANVESKNPWGSLALEWGADEQESWQRRFDKSRGLSSDLVRRLGYEPPRPSPSRSRDTDSDNSEEDPVDHSESDESAGESRETKKRPRMRMYADEEEGKQRKGKPRPAEPEDFGDKIAKLRAQQRIQDRLGPVSDLRNKIKSRLN